MFLLKVSQERTGQQVLVQWMLLKKVGWYAKSLSHSKIVKSHNFLRKLRLQLRLQQNMAAPRLPAPQHCLERYSASKNVIFCCPCWWDLVWSCFTFASSSLALTPVCCSASWTLNPWHFFVWIFRLSIREHL